MFFFYNSEWTNWAKLANTLKLRIAVRYERRDAEVTKRIFREVMENAIGPIDNDISRFVYDKPQHNPIGGDIDYRSPRFGTTSIISFLKATNDPRLKICFSPNDLDQIYIQQYLNFFRLGNEAFTFVRRTGYPANNSTYYKRNAWAEPIPRRYWLDEPLLGTNNANWFKSQGAGAFPHSTHNV